MGLFDIFSPNTTASTDAATSAAISSLGDTAGQNAGILYNTNRNANRDLTQGAAGATKALTQGYGDARTDLLNYGGQATGALQGGVDKAVGTVLGGNQYYQPAAATGGAASGMLSNALGLNGAGGNAAATSAFQAGPGYQFQLDQATDAAARKAASLGVAAGGNTLDGITRLSSNLANTEYGNWLTNLSNAAGQGLNAAAGISGNNQTAGGYQYGGGGLISNILSQLGSGTAGLDASKGTGLANIQSNLGTGKANLATNLGTALTGNNWTGAQDIANVSLADANAQDSAASKNNGILGNMLGSFFSPITGAASKSLGGLVSNATGGFL